jgi:hypothetical protein
MKELKLPVEASFSECAIEDATALIKNETQSEAWLLELHVSVFEAHEAVHMMIDSHRIRHVHITKEFQQGRYCLTDIVNQITVTGGIER